MSMILLDLKSRNTALVNTEYIVCVLEQAYDYEIIMTTGMKLCINQETFNNLTQYFLPARSTEPLPRPGPGRS